MAGETRRQRRDARRAAGDTPEQQPARTPQPAAAGPAEGADAPREQRGGVVRESWAELHKVEWPNRAQVMQGTIVVILACAVVGAYLWGIDQLIRPFVRDILIG